MESLLTCWPSQHSVMPKISLSWAWGCFDWSLPSHGQKREHKPSAFTLRATSLAEMLCLFAFIFSNLTCSVLNNLWKLFGNSGHSSSYSAWKQKMNGWWWFVSWEIWDQNQAGFIVASEMQTHTHKKKKRSIVMTFNPNTK